MRYLLLVSLLCLGAKAHAQGTSSAASTPVVLYDKAIGNQSHLYNGSGFQELPIHQNEHPFFASPEPTEGSVTYHDQLYNSISLQYNLVTDQVVTEDGSSGVQIQLVKDGVQSFNAFGHHFIQIKNDPSIGDGFYDLVYDGQSRVLVRREKSLQHKVRENVAQPWYQVKHKVYLGKAGQYQLVKSKKTVWQVVGSQKDLVKRQLRQNRVRYNANKEQYCSEALRYFESSTRK